MKNTTLDYLIVITILICSNCYSQKSYFIVTKSYDTIYVDKIILTDNELKTKTNGKKEKFNLNEIISFYDREENRHYERVKNPLKEKIQAQKIDRYDYRELENSYINDYEKRIEYNFFQRLTDGKVKLFTEGSIYRFLNSTPSSSNYMSATQINGINNDRTYNAKSYYLTIYDAKLELIYDAKLNVNSDWKSKFTYDDGNLKLTKEVFEILKIYLYGKDEITIKLDNLFSTKPIAKEKQIIDLINEYNNLVKSNK